MAFFPKLCRVINVSSFLFLEFLDFFLLQWWAIAVRRIETLLLRGAHLLAFKKKDEETARKNII